MSIISRMNSRSDNSKVLVSEKLYKEERNFRADRLREKWSQIPEIGKGFNNLEESVARNTALLLENQARVMAKLTETQLANSFWGFSPENMLRLVRLAYPNTIRNKLFTEYAMESVKDSIKYVRPVYTDSQHYKDTLKDKTFGAYGNPNDPNDVWNKKGDTGYFGSNYRKAMYETTEDRYVSELVNGYIVTLTANTQYYLVYNKQTYPYKPTTNEKVIVFGGLFTDATLETRVTGTSQNSPFEKYPLVDGYATVFATNEQQPVAMQIKSRTAEAMTTGGWLSKPEAHIIVTPISTAPGLFKIVQDEAQIEADANAKGLSGDAKTAYINSLVAAKAYARYNSEGDFTGEYLGEVEIVMHDYWFNPTVTAIGVTWSQLTEIVLDTSFGVSAEELFIDTAGQEIKKALDFRAVKLAYQAAKMNPAKYTVVFDAAAGNNTDDSYLHTAQTISQAIVRVGDIMFNDINRGGVTRIVGGPAATSYLTLNAAFNEKGKQEKIGGHQIGEIYGIPVFKVPSSVIPDDELLCIWKNETNESDIAVVFGTLIPFFSTGLIQRKNFYVESALASFGDWNVLQPRYLGIIKIKNIRVLADS